MTLEQFFRYDPDTGYLYRRCGPGYVMWERCGTKPGSNGYAHVAYQHKDYLVHRLAWYLMTGKWPDQLDHINRDRMDNRWENLREVGQDVNAKNRSLNGNNTSGTAGVYRYRGKWLARITVDYARVHLGVFDNRDDAVAARKAAEEKYWRLT